MALDQHDGALAPDRALNRFGIPIPAPDGRSCRLRKNHFPFPGHRPKSSTGRLTHWKRLPALRIAYQSDAPARDFPFCHKDLRQPSLARGVSRDAIQRCELSQSATPTFGDDAEFLE